MSAFWILVANSFMQSPTSYTMAAGASRPELTDIMALIFNPHVWQQFPHVLAGGIVTAGFFVIGISAWHLMRKGANRYGYETSLKFGAIFAFIGTIIVILAGHSQMQHLLKTQPMKVAAAEALWESENPASFSLFTVGDEEGLKDVFSIRVPKLLSFLAYNSFEGEVRGIKNLQKEYEVQYGPSNYMPSIVTAYWSFRFMAGSGALMLLIALLALYKVIRESYTFSPLTGALLFWSILLPWIANSSGWLLAEMGRQPWLVFGLLKTENGVSPESVVSSSEMMISLAVFVMLYAALAVTDFLLMKKYAVAGIETGE